MDGRRGGSFSISQAPERRTLYNAVFQKSGATGCPSEVVLATEKKEEKEKYSLKHNVLGFIISLFLRFLFYTSRKTYIGLENLTSIWDDDKSLIIVSWHNRNILGPFGYLAHQRKGRAFYPMASASKDGSLAAAGMKWLGVNCIRGSSSKGGTQALRAMIRKARSGGDLGITPDGPRGPAYRVQEGVITTAKLTGLALVPMTYQAKRKKILGSWDKMIVPYPFNRLNYVYGKPIIIPKKATEEELEQYRLELEQEMMRIVERSNQF